MLLTVAIFWIRKNAGILLLVKQKAVNGELNVLSAERNVLFQEVIIKYDNIIFQWVFYNVLYYTSIESLNMKRIINKIQNNIKRHNSFISCKKTRTLLDPERQIIEVNRSDFIFAGEMWLQVRKCNKFLGTGLLKSR